MVTENLTEGLGGAGAIIKKLSGWFIGMAVVFILLGMMAIIGAGVAGVAVTILVSGLLMFGGVAHLVAVLSGGGARRVVRKVLIGIVYILGGVYFSTHPLLALGTLSLLLCGLIWFHWSSSSGRRSGYS